MQIYFTGTITSSKNVIKVALIAKGLEKLALVTVRRIITKTFLIFQIVKPAIILQSVDIYLKAITSQERFHYKTITVKN